MASISDNPTEQDLSILRRLKAHGTAVRHTKMGFELDRGEFLCRMLDMSRLRTKGLVQKTEGNYYWLTPAGEAATEQAGGTQQ